MDFEVSGFDPATMEIEGNVAKSAGTYTITVTPKENWKDGSKAPVTTTWEIKKAGPDTVDAGDDMNILSWIVVMMLSLILMVDVACRRSC